MQRGIQRVVILSDGEAVARDLTTVGIKDVVQKLWLAARMIVSAG